MLIVFFRAIILYALVIFSIRLMGKRQIGELQPSELVITILLSNIATLPIEDTTIPMATGIIPMLTLVSLDVIMSALTLRSRKLRQMVSGLPPQQREIVILRFGQELTLREIAAVTETPLRTVQSRLRAALKELRKQMEDGGEKS